MEDNKTNIEKFIEEYEALCDDTGCEIIYNSVLGQLAVIESKYYVEYE